MSAFRLGEDAHHALERALHLAHLLADTMAEIGTPGRVITTVPAIQVAALGEAIARDLQDALGDCQHQPHA